MSRSGRLLKLLANLRVASSRGGSEVIEAHLQQAVKEELKRGKVIHISTSGGAVFVRYSDVIPDLSEAHCISVYD